ncbi:MAG: hypothetical protein ACK5XN_06585, partial [Bacteroidota bacterium]
LTPINSFWEEFQTDFVIPLIHGKFGEDGFIQSILEKKQIPYFFSKSKDISKMFLKNQFSETLKNKGFKSWDQIVILKNRLEENIDKIKSLHQKYKKLVIKPTNSGSSLNVFISDNFEKSITILRNFANRNMIIEEKHEGKEFSIAVCKKSMTPVEINYETDIFDHRGKYFPSDKVSIKIPPSFSIETTERIKKDAENIFKIFEAEDVIRIDGWVLNSGEVIYTECNPISSTEFNGILFQSLQDDSMKFMRNLINNKLEKNNLPKMIFKKEEKKIIPVIFGGNSSEIEISLLSACSVCIKINNSDKYSPEMYYLKGNVSDKTSIVYKIPNFFVFKRTLKDLDYVIENIDLYNKITNQDIKIEKMSFDEFIKNKDFIFITLHGGEGEDGTIQKKLEEANVKFNGSNSEISKLCMDKYSLINFLEQSRESRFSI